MKSPEAKAVIDACRTAFARTQNVRAAQVAAEAAYRELHPQAADDLVASRVQIILSRAIVAARGNFWHVDKFR